MRKQGTTVIAAGAISGNVLAGDPIEFPETASKVKMMAAASAVGVVGSARAGTRIYMTESAISQANRFPIEPDDRFVQDVARAGQRLGLEFRNPTAGPLTVYWAVDLDPIG